MSFSRRGRHFLIRKKGGCPTAPRVATECQIVLEEFKPRGFGQGDAALGLEDEVAQSRPTESRGPGNGGKTAPWFLRALLVASAHVLIHSPALRAGDGESSWVSSRGVPGGPGLRPGWEGF